MVPQKQIYKRISSLVILVALIFSGCDGGTNETGPETPLLVSPGNGAGQELTATELQWDSATSATSYHLQLAKTADFTAPVLDDPQVTSISVPLLDLDVGDQYYWRIKAKNDLGESNWSDAWSFRVAKEGYVPPIPQLALPTDGVESQPTQIYFTWDAVNGANTYHIQVSLEENFIRRSADVADIRNSAALIRGLIPTYTYYWRVRSENPLGTSEWSPTRYLIIGEDEEYGNQ